MVLFKPKNQSIAGQFFCEIYFGLIHNSPFRLCKRKPFLNYTKKAVKIKMNDKNSMQQLPCF